MYNRDTIFTKQKRMKKGIDRIKERTPKLMSMGKVVAMTGLSLAIFLWSTNKTTAQINSVQKTGQKKSNNVTIPATPINDITTDLSINELPLDTVMTFVTQTLDEKQYPWYTKQLVSIYKNNKEKRDLLMQSIEETVMQSDIDSKDKALVIWLCVANIDQEILFTRELEDFYIENMSKYSATINRQTDRFKNLM